MTRTAADTCPKFTSGAEALRARVADARGVTLIHGDPNPTNVLTPLAGEPHPPAAHRPLYLIDRQPFAWSLQTWLAACELVHAAVPFWEPDERRALEPVLLPTYHETLLRRGVLDHDWSRLLEDYRLCLVHAVHVGVDWGKEAEEMHAMRWLWEPQLERAWQAMRDRSSVPAALQSRCG